MESTSDSMDKYRKFLKSDSFEELSKIETDQRKRLPHPPIQKPYPEDAELFDLVEPDNFIVGEIPVIELIRNRRSRRRFTDDSLTLEELSFLLWATQGIQNIARNGVATFRTVPSAGARHSFETYLFINRVERLKPGLYRYLPVEHKLCFCYEDTDLDDKIVDGCYGQSFVKDAAVVFIWTTIPYRTEWRYSIVSHKVIAIDAGHLCQNLYLASESIGAGTCAIGAYNQKKMDNIIQVDGKDEFTIYVAPVGKIP